MVAQLDASKLKVTKSQTLKSYPPSESLVFGQVMTDHILTAEWDAETGWAAPEIKPYGDFHLDPASAVLHYAFCCFEGQKAFRDIDGKTRIFRPENNIERLNRSCARIALPQLDVEEGVKLLKEFVRLEQAAIPEGRGFSLYLRPTVIGTSVGLGVAAPNKALLYIIASPVGKIIKSGSTGIRLKATDDAVRAWPGGTGNAKLGANYAPCVVPQRQAAQEGFDQNLWLFDGYLTEVGMMNFFLVFKDPKTGKKELTTAPLDGLILEGITRLSILELARERLDPKEWDIVERKVHINELIERNKKGEVLEAFGAGTAAIVSPVSEVNFHGESVVLPTGSGSDITSTIQKWIQDIQYGVEDHPFAKRI